MIPGSKHLKYSGNQGGGEYPGLFDLPPPARVIKHPPPPPPGQIFPKSKNIRKFLLKSTKVQKSVKKLGAFGTHLVTNSPMLAWIET